MSILSLFKAALYAYIVMVMQRVALGVSQNEKQIDELGVNATESDFLHIERLGKEVARGNQQLSTLRSLIGDD